MSATSNSGRQQSAHRPQLPHPLSDAPRPIYPLNTRARADGFTGADNNDGHSEEGHNIEGEHRLLEGLANHSIRKEDFPSEEYFIAWEMTNISIVI